MTTIDKAFILRLYALHGRMTEEIDTLSGELLFNRDADKIVASIDHLDILADEMETVFAEVLTDEERNVPTDEETVGMVNEIRRQPREKA
jgi:hypothetical protein